MAASDSTSSIVSTVDATQKPFQVDDLPSRYVMFPIHYPQIWEAYKKQLTSFWVAEEVDLSSDFKGWEKLTSDEQHFLKMVLAFFAASDGIVLENLAVRFMKDVQLPEARAAYSFQLLIETIHSEMYSLLIETLIKDKHEQTQLFRAVENFPAIGEKAQWARKWIESSQPFGQRLAAFAAVEGVFFSGSFCAIFWLKKRGINMPGLFLSNQFISRDEGMHADFACLLYSMIPEENRLPTSTLHALFMEAVQIEERFITESLPVNLIGMNSESMIQYIHYVADRLLKQLGYPVLFGEANPFEWMLTIALQGKSNFFETRVADYGHSHLMARSVGGHSKSTDTYGQVDDF